MLKDIILLGIGAAFGLGGALMGLAAPLYFPTAPAWVWHWVFWGGLVIMAIMLADAGILLVWGRAVTLPAAILGNFGAVLLAAAVIAQTNPLSRKNERVETPVGELLLECQPMALPTSGPPRENTLVMISPFRTDKEGTIGISQLPTEWGEPIKWPEGWKNKMMSSARCRLTNYGALPLFNVEVPFRVIFKKIARGETPGNFTASETVTTTESFLPITKIESGPDAAYVFYIHNQGRDVINTEFLDAATCLPPRSTERRSVTLIQSTNIGRRFMSLWPVRDAEEIIAEEEKANGTK